MASLHLSVFVFIFVGCLLDEGDAAPAHSGGRRSWGSRRGSFSRRWRTRSGTLFVEEPIDVSNHSIQHRVRGAHSHHTVYVGNPKLGASRNEPGRSTGSSESGSSGVLQREPVVIARIVNDTSALSTYRDDDNSTLQSYDTSRYSSSLGSFLNRDIRSVPGDGDDQGLGSLTDDKGHDLRNRNKRGLDSISLDKGPGSRTDGGLMRMLTSTRRELDD